MKIETIILLFIFFFIIDLNIYSQVLISGAFRNDTVFRFYEDELKGSKHFNDILENKLILRHEGEDWKFYADGRLYLYFGESRQIKNEYNLKLMRSFIRYSPAIGDFTFGKTYINFGNPGIFNLFEINKQVLFTDIYYDKEGMLALEYDLPIGDLTGCKIYTGTYESESDIYTGSRVRHNASGINLRTNALGFDFGAVANRIRKDANIAGAYFKGDLVLGVQGAYAYHFNDKFKKPDTEANFGIDYSFFNSNLIISSIIYYNHNGADRKDEYNIIPDPDVYFNAKYYMFSNIIYKYDEFLNFEIGGFLNLIDNSSIIYPSVRYLLADGLSAAFFIYFFTGTDNEEFSRDTAGIVNTLIRVEAKF